MRQKNSTHALSNELLFCFKLKIIHNLTIWTKPACNPFKTGVNMSPVLDLS